jgi:hypothetical protein
MAVGVTLGAAALLWAHCDTMDGPVVSTGQSALSSGDLTPVLKWIKPEQEKEIRAVFTQARTVRAQSDGARELADRLFLETLVRLHRAGEGEPFTGLKASSEDVSPAVAAADKALQNGQIDPLVQKLVEQASEGIRHRYQRVQEAQRHANDSVDAGRAYVAAYVEFMHYVERLDSNTSSSPTHDHRN